MAASAIEVPQSDLGLGGAPRRISGERTLFLILPLYRAIVSRPSTAPNV
jgi:hypothetical protein